MKNFKKKFDWEDTAARVLVCGGIVYLTYEEYGDLRQLVGVLAVIAIFCIIQVCRGKRGMMDKESTTRFKFIEEFEMECIAKGIDPIDVYVYFDKELCDGSLIKIISELNEQEEVEYTLQAQVLAIELDNRKTTGIWGKLEHHEYNKKFVDRVGLFKGKVAKAGGER